METGTGWRIAVLISVEVHQQFATADTPPGQVYHDPASSEGSPLHLIPKTGRMSASMSSDFEVFKI
jgi:hypothetical protein